jgi:carbamoyltransferase
MRILGISAYYHDSAAALLQDGEIVAAAQEERFSRKKHDERFPINAVRYCLEEAGLRSGEIEAVVFYDKPLLKFERILQTYFNVAPRGLRSFLMAMPVWLRQKLWIPLEIETRLEELGVRVKESNLYFLNHHESHAASAFYPSPFSEAAILTLDGVGEWTTSSLGRGRGNKIELLQEMRFPHSLGLLYSAFTYFTGFRVNSGEYKLMGLAPYGRPRYADRILEHLVDLKADGSFRLNLKYFGFLDGLTMTNPAFAELFDGPPRKPESEITQREMDLASSIQHVTEEIVLRMARRAKEITQADYLCLAGGVALNCVANGRLLREKIFRDIWIQPAAGDAGGALGAALFVWHQLLEQPRRQAISGDTMRGAYLGPEYSDEGIERFLRERGYPAEKVGDTRLRAERLAQLVEQENVIGLFQGRMEFGPRALGNRSIIGDARSARMQSTMNLKIKYRESFRPFAPACLEERKQDYFELDRPSPYMLLVAPVNPARRTTADDAALPLRERVHTVRSDIPAVTHVDFSARIQTVDRDRNPFLHRLLETFSARTGCGVIINTSFNVRGEPIVCTPADAYQCFMRTEMDYLVLGSFILSKREQPPWTETVNWRKDYVLD